MLHETIIKDASELSEWALKRMGFIPDKLVRAVGVTMGENAKHKQKILELARPLCGPDTAPPVQLVREPDNKFDPGAIKVYLGFDVTLVGNEKKWTFGQVGYVPKGFTIPAYKVDGTKSPSFPDGIELWKLMDYVENKQAPGTIRAAVNFIAKAGDHDALGLEIGIKHDHSGARAA